MSDKCQHHLRIYHFTLGKEGSFIVYKYCKVPTAIGAEPAHIPNEDLGLTHPAYISIYSIQFTRTFEGVGGRVKIRT